jgi:galactokinase
VCDAVGALTAGDLVRLGALLNASTTTQISTPEIDTLVALSRGDHDVYGARLTGGGFGGSVVILVQAGLGSEVACRILRSD